ncbi:protein Z, vitamin K-dependent plasma glycoprotein b isoform X2 [Toxotes jaculatrix]|uniref:protein Z, vitamin K-dependent plasma glycoprotein b isoform X2 n=1 Tax=Toxotes jaculatrix TaxID=941984 RepID=UPI001B3AF789|nr:protein Z, vitamin K-dependent plasma glycoprotein b isoform X2 [Toxotes jaculatrix]
MAVSIMSACCRASVLSLHLLACFLQVLSQGEVFRQAPQAHSLLLRSRRANLFLFEEILPGNLERECYEELCNFEEAREYFEDTEKTTAFWTVYLDGDQCVPNPCLHGGNCTDKVGGFQCSCTAPHFGPECELVLDLEHGGQQPPSAPQVTTPEIAECPTEGPTACHQLCTASQNSFSCSCMPGFKLQTDKRSCVPEVEFPCGRLPDKFNTTVSMCRHGNCPWQVSLLNSRGVELCGAVVLGRFSVLTAAHCLLLDSGSNLRLSNFYVVAGNSKMLVPVQALYIHDRFSSDHHDNDLALLELATPLPFGPALIHLCLPNKDFSENILMHSGRAGITGRLGVGQNQDLVYMTLDECRSQLNVSHPLSNKMFCMRRQNGATGRQNGHLRNPNEAQGRSRGSLGNRNEIQRKRHGPLRNHNGTQRPNGPLGDQNGAQGRLNRHEVNSNQNPSQNTQGGVQGTPNGAENQNNSSSKTDNQKPSVPDGGLRSEVSAMRCSGLLPGSPVATVEKGTAFLTGLLISSSTRCDGGGGSSSLVFTKLSRYLSWIRPRLEVAEDRMTPQVNQYPEAR